MDDDRLLADLPDPPAGGDARWSVEEGGVRIELKPVIPARHKRAFFAILILTALGGFGSFLIGIAMREPDGPLWPWPVIAWGAAGGVFFLIGFHIFLIGTIISMLRGEAVFGGDTLFIDDQNRTFSLPVDQVRALRAVLRSKNELIVDLERPPLKSIRRGRGAALDIEMPEGRLRLFKTWDREELEWLTQVLSAVLGVPHEPTVDLNQTSPDLMPTADAWRLYGRDRKMLLGLCLVAVLGLSLLLFWHVPRGWASRDWPAVEGSVLHAHYAEIEKGDSTQYTAEMKYTYRVGGDTYTNDYIGFTYMAGDERVKDLVESHPPDSTVRVYYNPEEPADSVLLPGVSRRTWWGVIPVLGMVGLCLGMWIRKPSAEEEALVGKYKVAQERKR